MFQHPVHSLLNPDPAALPVPAEFTAVRVELDRGLPTPLSLAGIGFSVLLSVPTGRVRYWLTQPGADLIASHAQQREPHPSDGRGDKPWEDVHPVLVFRENNATMAILPLMVNARTLLPRLGETSGSALEIVIQSFSLSVQAMRGPQAGSSWVQLAWQRLERGSDAFIAPIARRKLRQRLSATVGTGDTRQKRQISADMYSEGAPERLSGALRGGINWRLTHD